MKSRLKHATAVVSALLILASSIHAGGAILVDDSPIVDDPDDPDDMAIVGSAEAVEWGNASKTAINSPVILMGMGVNAGKSAISSLFGSNEELAESMELVQVKIALYKDAYKANATNKYIQNLIDNNIMSGRVPKKMEALNAVAEAKKNGKTEQQAVNAGMSVLKNRTAKSQINLITSWNIYMQKIDSVGFRAAQENIHNISTEDRYPLVASSGNGTVDEYGTGSFITLAGTSNNYGIATPTKIRMTKWEDQMSGKEDPHITLKNGSTKMTAIAYEDDGIFNPWRGVYAGNNGTRVGWDRGENLKVSRPSSQDINVSEYLPEGADGAVNLPFNKAAKLYHQKWMRLDQQYNATKLEIQSVASDIYAKDTNLSAYDVTQSPYLIEQVYGNEDQSALLASMYQQSGMLGPRLDEVGNTTIQTENNQTYTGILLAENPPNNNTFQVGETYNATNLGSTYMMNETGQHPITGEFTISDAYSTEGTSLDAIDVHDRSLEVSNADEYLSALQNFNELYAESQAREEDAESGAGLPSIPEIGGWFSGLAQMAQAIVIGAILLLLGLLLLR